MTELLDAARALAWWTHCNLSSPALYRARQESFARLRDALRDAPPDATAELRFVVDAAYTLAACSDSNRMGAPYYERKAAFAQLRGALAVYDESPAYVGRDRRRSERRSAA